MRKNDGKRFWPYGEGIGRSYASRKELDLAYKSFLRRCRKSPKKMGDREWLKFNGFTEAQINAYFREQNARHRAATDPLEIMLKKKEIEKLHNVLSERIKSLRKLK